MEVCTCGTQLVPFAVSMDKTFGACVRTQDPAARRHAVQVMLCCRCGRVQFTVSARRTSRNEEQYDYSTRN